jgi:hypothetical protein
VTTVGKWPFTAFRTVREIAIEVNSNMLGSQEGPKTLALIAAQQMSRICAGMTHDNMRQVA